MLSASMMQANGYYAWVILPANTVGGRGFSKGDADSFNVFTLASPANLAFADGSGAAFAAPAIAAEHPVFKLGFSAGYRKRDRKWYPVPNFGDIVDRRTDKELPVALTNRWLAPIPQDETTKVATLLDDAPAAAQALSQAQAEQPEVDENAVMVAEYLTLQSEYSSCSAVLDKLGTKLERRGLIEKRTVDCLKAWLTENNLPLPSKTATPSEAETEPEPAQDPPPTRKRVAV